MKSLKQSIRLQVTTKSDAGYLYRLMEMTMREYVESVWGRWNEVEARRFTAEAAASGEFSLIYLENQCVGAINVEEHPAYIQLEQLYIEPRFQRQGVGTCLMRDIMTRSAKESRPVRLRVLKPNPARQYYERLGFEVVEESNERYFLQYDVKYYLCVKE